MKSLSLCLLLALWGLTITGCGGSEEMEVAKPQGDESYGMPAEAAAEYDAAMRADDD